MVIICLHTKFHKPSSDCSLVTAIKPKTMHSSYRSHVVKHTFYKRSALTIVAYFSRIYYQHNFSTLSSVALVSLPPHTFMRPLLGRLQMARR